MRIPAAGRQLLSINLLMVSLVVSYGVTISSFYQGAVFLKGKAALLFIEKLRSD
jgi:hypothetical protein